MCAFWHGKDKWLIWCSNRCYIIILKGLVARNGKTWRINDFHLLYQKKNTVIGQTLFFSFSDQIKPVFQILLKIKTEAKDAKDRHLEILTGSSYWGWCSRNSTKSFYSAPEQKGKVITCSPNIFLPHASSDMLAKHTPWKAQSFPPPIDIISPLLNILDVG